MFTSLFDRTSIYRFGCIQLSSKKSRDFTSEYKQLFPFLGIYTLSGKGKDVAIFDRYMQMKRKELERGN